MIHEIYAYTKKEKDVAITQKLKYSSSIDFNTTHLLPGCNGIYHTSLGFLEGIVAIIIMLSSTILITNS